MRRLALLVVVAGCSMYGAPAEHLHTVPTVKPPPPTPAQPPVYELACTVDFHGKPTTVRKPQVASTKTVEGDTTIASATKATTDQARADLLISGISHYKEALRADPYDAGATLKLALAYDKALHKGCALALLKRLESLAQNPKLAPDAPQRIDDIVDNPQWFRDYRKDALQAVDR